MEKARCNTELYSNLRAPLNNVKPSNFWGSHHDRSSPSFIIMSRRKVLRRGWKNLVQNAYENALDTPNLDGVKCDMDIKLH